ncbi:MAG: IS66 family transposase [Spirochaeta sp.]|nr:IS66 family transposase [Spirochaeta sp.]
MSTIAKLYSAESKPAEWLRDEQFLAKRYEMVESELLSFHKWLTKKAEHVPPKSSLGKAVGYTLGQWEKLLCYLESPYLTPDTNRVENKIRLSLTSAELHRLGIVHNNKRLQCSLTNSLVV